MSDPSSAAITSSYEANPGRVAADGQADQTRPRPRPAPAVTRRPAAAGRPDDLVAQLGRPDEGLGLAVVDDVGRLLAGEVPVDRRQPQAGPLGRVEHLDELGPVGAHEGDAVARSEAPGPQRPDQAVAVGVELAEGAVADRR